nr:hypothetical protein [uncultured Rhodopila sp.]
MKFAADVAVLPGSSRIVEGDLGRGLLYAGGGILSRYLLPGAFGAFGWVAIGLDAFSVSSSGKHLWELGSRQRAKPPVDEDLSTAS